jgi:hypothetical protein
MRKFLRKFLLILSCVSGLLSLTISFIAIQRYRLEYNSEGRFFDPAGAIVYDIDARDVYILFSIVFWLITFLLAFILYHSRGEK